MTIETAVVGYGYWGPNLVRNFSTLEGAHVRWVCDRDKERLALVKKRFPDVQTTTRYEDVLGDSHVHACAISTPVSTHYDLARKALEAGKHVLSKNLLPIR